MIDCNLYVQMIDYIYGNEEVFMTLVLKHLIIIFVLTTFFSINGVIGLYLIYYSVRAEMVKINESKKESENNARRVSAMISG